MDNLLVASRLVIDRGHNLICGDFSLQVEAGQRWGIIGKNGRGKTTLLHTLAGLLPTSSGTLHCLGEPINQLRRRILANRLGLLLQTQQTLFPAIVQDVIMAGAYARRKASNEELRQLLVEFELAELADKNILDLSGGEQQRVAIARLVFQKPHLYLLDEPTQHLDPHIQHKVLTYFSERCTTEHKALLFSSHDVNLIEQYCDYVVLMLPEGRILCGPKSELLTAQNLEAIFGCYWLKVGDTNWKSSAHA